MYEIRYQRTFCATHALKLPHGSHEPTHGHDWCATVAVDSQYLDETDCVMDFHALEQMVQKVVSAWEGSHLNDAPPFADGINPSAERVAQQLGLAVEARLPKGVRLIWASVTEAPGCTAVWRP